MGGEVTAGGGEVTAAGVRSQPGGSQPGRWVRLFSKL